MKVAKSHWSVLLMIALWAGCTDGPKLDRLLVVVNKSENTASILDRETGKGVATIVTGVGPHEVAAHQAAGLAVVSNYGNQRNPGSSLTVINLRNRRAVRTIGLREFRRPHGIKFFNDGRRVAVTAEGNRVLLVVDVLTGAIEQVIPTNQELSHMVVISQDETRAYVSNIGSGTISVVDLETASLLNNLPSGEGAEGLDLSHDGSQLWVANRAEDTLSVFQTETLSLVEKVPCASFPIRVAFTADGERVLVSNARSGDVALFSANDRREVVRIPMELTATERTDRLLQFDLSPVPVGIVVSGETAYVANSNADIVTAVDLRAARVVQRLHPGEEPDGMAVVDLTVPE